MTVGRPRRCGQVELTLGEQNRRRRCVRRCGVEGDERDLAAVIAEKTDAVELPAQAVDDQNVAIEACVRIVVSDGRKGLQAGIRIDVGEKDNARAVGRPGGGGCAAAQIGELPMFAACRLDDVQLRPAIQNRHG